MELKGQYWNQICTMFQVETPTRTFETKKNAHKNTHLLRITTRVQYVKTTNKIIISCLKLPFNGMALLQANTYRYAQKIQSAKLMEKFQCHVVARVVEMIQLWLNR